MENHKRDEQKIEKLKSTVKGYIEHHLGKDCERAGIFDNYIGIAYAVRDRLIERWLSTQRSYYKRSVKRVYYLSLEFLVGRTLGNSMVNLGIDNDCTKALENMGCKMEDIWEAEWDAGLGNGGLGRLAACFLDSLATLGVPSYGYGIKYEYGLFYQKIKGGYQIETPDNWLRYGNPWEIDRPGHLFPVHYYGRVNQYIDSQGIFKNEWVDTEEVMAMACDISVPGYKNDNVINMRLWTAKSSRDFDLTFFNSGNYIQAVEKWPVSIFENLLPRHIQIIYEINRRFLEEVNWRFPGDLEKRKKMSLIEEGDEKMIRMANLAIVGSHSTNGVSKLHTELLKNQTFKDFYDVFPERFNNKTNGITPRRWLKKANPLLSDLITEKIGDGWVTNLDELKKIAPLAEDKKFREKWMEVKRENKKTLAAYILKRHNITVDAESMFDVQIKRMHEYKRQLLNVLHVITLYNRIKNKKDVASRTVIFAGKAAPAYWMAKLIIKLIHSVAEVVNHSKAVNGKLKVIFMNNYNVSLAEKIIPAADLSEQISTAGTEASGTGNMKLSLNGALTIGTLDGANIEIMEEVGKENFFIFGLTAEEVLQIKNSGYSPYYYCERNQELKEVLNMIEKGYFSPENTNLFKPIVDSLLRNGDTYMLLADYESYINCQERVSKLYKDRHEWAKKSILNVANMGKFSSDRTIKEYAKEIWGINLDKDKSLNPKS